MPLVVAANRDEYLERPAEGFALREPGFLAPRDAREGGTWLGVNRHGVFVGLTNRPTGSPDRSRRSRGLLVQDVLGAESARAAAAELERLPLEAYNPFNLLVADASDAFVTRYEAEPKVWGLEPGAPVVGNADPNDRGHPKVARLLVEAGVAARVPAAGVLDALAAVCRVHLRDGTPFEDTCIHAGGYGTRSSTLLALRDEPGRDALRHADGPPCTTPYRDLTPLLRELGPSRVATGTPNTRNER